ncbi:glycosyltransferase family 2 protein [Methylobacterium durans]|uniref:glycosyltransferase family 2 protein n=1 Tax=Methylobacterium durans TaxID=2202825 RepID=UPI002AFFE1CE|nr:glycosyltransferase family 2 protein [Methylobacterium durans]MEA1830982.1 glycosyltransferase family 2 protein [Methylobacterium durans]
MSLLRAAISLLTGRTARRRAAAEAKIRASGLFDTAWYAGQKGGRTRAPLRHFMARAFRESAPWPNPLFDPVFYCENHPDLKRMRFNPLLHYAEYGEAEGRRPNLSFDPVWYANEYGLDGPEGALRHYLTEGARLGLRPARDFDPEAYLENHPDLGLTAAQAFAHHVRTTAEASAGAKGQIFNGLAYRAEGGERPRYRFEKSVQPYCYVPPRRPDDVDARLAHLGARPLFSIVTPVYNVERRFLEAAIASVAAQWYPDWELVLVDDCSTRAETRAALEAIDDPRIKVRFSPHNRGIAPTTNAALAEATGEYVVFLDNDDELTPDCLYELALCIDRTGADFVYSDEDKIDGEGLFSMPFFKPDWSPDALMSIMYTCHVSCMRRSLIEAAGGLRQGFEGAQDYDLTLRVTERTTAIAHVPKVLYHWRTLPSSLASDMAAKPYAHDSVRRLKEEALTRRGIPGTVEPVAAMPGQFRVNYSPRGTPTVSIVIPSKDNPAMLRRCVDSILKVSTYRSFEIVVIDNGSTQRPALKTLEELRKLDAVTILSDPSPFNYSAINNLGARTARGEILLFLNDDTEILSPDWLERLAGYAQRDHVGAVGARLLFPDGKIQHCGIVNLYDGPGHAFYRRNDDQVADFGRNTLEFDWVAVTGACLAIERRKFVAVGGFDETLPVAYNDVELCFRLVEAGYFNVVCQNVRLVHHESVTRGDDQASREKRERLRRDMMRLYARHPGFLARDPFHSRNLNPLSGLFLPNPV